MTNRKTEKMGQKQPELPRHTATPCKKKILIRIGSMRHGGAEKVLATFLKNIPEDKYEIDLLLNLRFGKYLPEIPGWINVVYLNKGEMIITNRLREIPVKAYRKIYQGTLKLFPKIIYNTILKGKKYDIELATSSDMLDEMIKSPLKSKKIVWLHTDIGTVYGKSLLPQLLKADKILAISDIILQYFPADIRASGQVVKIWNPIDTNEILQLAEQKKLDKANTSVFLAVGTVYPAKGFDRLLRSHKKLIDEGLLHKVQIVGDGYDFENITKLISELGVEDSVEMLGFTDNPYPYFKNADFYVLSSRYEGFPTVLFEAITLKKNIIATEVSGVREMLLDGELGMIVENSEAGIYSGMKKALTETFSFEKYRHNLKNYEPPFNLRNSVNKIMEILDGL